MEYKYENSERFCTNIKCNWQGHRVTTPGKYCPICGTRTSGFSGNDGFTMTGPQPSKQYPTPLYPEDYEPYEDNRKEFIRPYNKRYILGPDVKTDLPKNYHYYGMNKLKGGKGYRDNHPIGVIGHQCPGLPIYDKKSKKTYNEKCEGHIISIQMCTSSRGFTTTSEKVCDICGLIIPGSFQMLEKIEEHYTSKPCNTHDEWLQQNNPSYDYDDIDAEHERTAIYNGHRENTSDAEGYGDEYTFNYINKAYKARLDQAIGRLNNVSQSKHMPMKAWRQKEYNDIVDDYAHELEMLPYQVADVKWIIGHHPTILKIDKKVDDIIECICLYVIVKSYSNYRKGNAYIARYSIENPHIKTLYKVIRETLNV